jgi:hypothetical protein
MHRAAGDGVDGAFGFRHGFVRVQRFGDFWRENFRLFSQF